MELNDSVQQIEESMDKFNKELLNQATEKLEQLAQQFGGRRTTKTGETSFNEGPMVHTSPRGNENFHNFMPRTVKLDFLKYDGKE